MLRATASDHATNWPAYLPSVMSVYRMIVHSVTGMTPNMAMFGRGTLLNNSDCHTTWWTIFVISFHDTLRQAHESIRQTTQSAAKTQKSYFDQHVKGSPFAVGQLVWLYWPRPPIRQQKRKLQHVWTEPWKILSFFTHLVVKIRHIKSSKTQTVLVDRLTPCKNQSEHLDEPSTTPVATSSPSSTTFVEHQSSTPPPPIISPPTRTSCRTKRPPKYLANYTAVWNLGNH